MTVKLTDEEVRLLRELLSLDLEGIGFDEDETDAFDIIRNKLIGE